MFAGHLWKFVRAGASFYNRILQYRVEISTANWEGVDKYKDLSFFLYLKTWVILKS